MVKELGRLREEKTKGKQDYLSLEGYTVSNLGLQPGVSRLQGKISLEGYTPAKMAAGAAAPKAHAILLHRQRRSKVAQVAFPLWGRGTFFCSRHTLQGAFLVFLFSATQVPLKSKNVG